ncbi:Purine nucleoside phosphoramidase [Buchnera aphidicola (Takecallis arundicolens)]
MINIKNFMIIIFLMLLSINVVSGLIIYTNNKTRIQLNTFINKKNMLYTFQSNNIKNRHCNNLLNLIIFGINCNFHIFNYFTIGYHVEYDKFKLNKLIDILNNINLVFINVKINRFFS